MNFFPAFNTKLAVAFLASPGGRHTQAFLTKPQVRVSHPFISHPGRHERQKRTVWHFVSYRQISQEVHIRRESFDCICQVVWWSRCYLTTSSTLDGRSCAEMLFEACLAGRVSAVQHNRAFCVTKMSRIWKTTKKIKLRCHDRGATLIKYIMKHNLLPRTWNVCEQMQHTTFLIILEPKWWALGKTDIFENEFQFITSKTNVQVTTWVHTKTVSIKSISQPTMRY